MFAIVADVERYPEFVPWCAGTRILRHEREGDYDVMYAETLIGYKVLRERYISRVLLDPAAGTIDVTQTEGPFRVLENHWRFTAEGEGCRVEFSIFFEFKNPMLGMIAAGAMNRVMCRMTDAFEARAATLRNKSRLCPRTT